MDSIYLILFSRKLTGAKLGLGVSGKLVVDYGDDPGGAESVLDGGLWVSEGREVAAQKLQAECAVACGV